MVYKVLRFIVKLSLKIYHKKIYLNGAENLVPGQPYFIACNHPAGFLEPLLLACFLNRDLHFLTRGDFFYNPFLKPLLVSTNQIPIFRTRDGFSNLRNNKKTVEIVSQKLKEGEAILIFIEGSTKLVKWLRPLTKGMARMTFRSMEQVEGLKPKVLPIGMSFTHLNKFREEVLIKINKPLEVSEYLDLYNDQNIKGISKLTNDTSESMKTCMVNIDEDKEEAYETISNLWRSQLNLPFMPIFNEERSRIEDEISIAEKINVLPNEKAEELGAKSEKWLLEFSRIKSYGNLLVLIPAIIGYITNWLPAMIGVWFADSMIKNMVFYAPIRMVAGMVGFILYYSILLILILVYDVKLLLILLVFIICGMLYLYYRHSIDESRKKKVTQAMRSSRTEILTELNLVFKKDN